MIYVPGSTGNCHILSLNGAGAKSITFEKEEIGDRGLSAMDRLIYSLLSLSDQGVPDGNCTKGLVPFCTVPFRTFLFFPRSEKLIG